MFGEVAANHALSDCHAMCADARTALAIVTVPYGLPAEVEETIFQVMAGACAVLRDAGCALVGGHTAEGAELSVGFAVNGVARASGTTGTTGTTGIGGVLRKGGSMQAGDKVVLTKAVGTGALFAAHMRGLIEGPAVTGALAAMRVSNQQAARVLRDVGGATACTDVTGFGVAGHLGEMLRASDDNDKFNRHFLLAHRYFGADLSLDALPVLPGALDALAQGVTSSLQAANLAARHTLIGAADDTPEARAVRAHPAYPLLFDPQTAGGLLATVPAARAAETVAALRRLGFTDACVLGTVREVPSPVERLRVTTTRDPLTAPPPDTVVFRKKKQQQQQQLVQKKRPRLSVLSTFVSALIWPENRGVGGAGGGGGGGGGGGRRQLLLGLLLGLATAYVWGAVGRAWARSSSDVADMICIPRAHE